MFLLDSEVITSASDLSAASKCEFEFLRRIDVRLGRIERPDETVDAMYERTSALGDAHEQRVLDDYRAEFGDGVIEVERPSPLTAETIAAAAGETKAAFEAGAAVVFQATFASDGFIGFADFIVRQPDGSYQVHDTKLARRARVTALLQLAAYTDELARIGVRVHPEVVLILGDGSRSIHRRADITPVYHRRRARLLQIIDEHLREDGPVEWGDPRYAVCGHCDACAAEIEASRDVLLVAGLRVTQREKLNAADIRTLDDLASSAGPVEGIGNSTLDGLRTQARLQLQAVKGQPPPVVVVDAVPLHSLPAPDPGDIFFDFEGDPLYTEGDGSVWNLDYLFGCLDGGGFTPIWAHDFAEERAALRTFLDYVAERRARNPGLHIYHYAAYEKTHLLGIAARYGVGEDEVDELLRAGVLVDLYPVVRKALRVGSPSYSIKKLEPLYMGDDLREGDVTNAAASIVEYHAAAEARDTGDAAGFERMLASIADYNEYDCRSTSKLRDWLLELAEQHPATVPEVPERAEPEPKISAVKDELERRAGDPLDPARTADEHAYALSAAAVDYHWRERKIFWQGHFARLTDPIESWADARDVFVIAGAEVVRDWYREGRQKADRRRLRVNGELAPGSRYTEDSALYVIYDHPGPYGPGTSDPASRSFRDVSIIELCDDGSLIVEERQKQGDEPHARLPIALTPGAPPKTDSIEAAIEEWGAGIVAAGDAWPDDPAGDLLRRVEPRTGSGALAAAASVDSTIPALVASLLDLDDSYLAVQGPPGAGKTYTGGHVIAALVAHHGWKIGVVAQSHNVVQNLLTAVVEAGLDPARVAKAPKSGTSGLEWAFTELRADGHQGFAQANAAGGYVIGGTVWDFTNRGRIGAKQLDLLVIDEAGQFSLANTIAVSTAARNLLMLGDPQQLPQVSQATHPEPVDGSALGWVASGHDVLPAEFGYFLSQTRRMHPALTEHVSTLSYEGKLTAHECTGERALEGVEPGLHRVPVVHEGDAVESRAEAVRITDLVRGLIGKLWSAPDKKVVRRPLGEDDLIVITPYNAQLALVREHLDAAGFTRVRVGTVDKFQGQEAVIALVTLAASSAADVPRGMSFLIMKNRLNVAVSRGQWAAYLVHSPALMDYLPVTPEGVAELSAFIRLATGER
jgi:uncharacterized protein